MNKDIGCDKRLITFALREPLNISNRIGLFFRLVLVGGTYRLGFKNELRNKCRCLAECECVCLWAGAGAMTIWITMGFFKAKIQRKWWFCWLHTWEIEIAKKKWAKSWDHVMCKIKFAHQPINCHKESTMHSTSDTRYISSSVRGAFQLVHHERFRLTSNRVEQRTKDIGRFNFFYGLLKRRRVSLNI